MTHPRAARFAIHHGPLLSPPFLLRSFSSPHKSPPISSITGSTGLRIHALNASVSNSAVDWVSRVAVVATITASVLYARASRRSFSARLLAVLLALVLVEVVAVVLVERHLDRARARTRTPHIHLGRAGPDRGVPGPGPVARLCDSRRGLFEFALNLGDTYASVELLRRYPNLVVLRTFSKVYGLAALRVGYGLCVLDAFRIAVDQVRQPFYLNAAAQAAAVEALKHQDEVERRVTQTLAARLDLEEGVRGLGVWVAESDANFIWLHLPDGLEEAAVVSGLRERGVLVRAGASLGREGALRVSVGTAAENDRFVGALDGLLRG